MKPSKRQLEFMDWEFGLFFHFGIRTFCPGHQDWDGREEELKPEYFNPERLDCRQWIRTAKEAGAKYTVLTAKHHDGFANWPSKYTDYSVAASPWKGGKGDVVAEYVEACREYGMKTGLYYSPADADFRRQKIEGRAYDDLFINQITELLTNYGEIDYLWFDACGSENHEYDKLRIMRTIRSLQPDILVFNMWEPDTRWIGNEAGMARPDNDNLVERVAVSVRTSQAEELSRPMFLPGECDVQMRPSTWFTSEDNADEVKTLDELMGLYDYSVGRGANLLLNIGPDASGLLPMEDTMRLLEFAGALRERFSDPILEVGTPLLNEDGEYLIELPEMKMVNCIVLKENLEEGTAVTHFSIAVHPPKSDCPVVVWERSRMGHKAVCAFPAVYGKRFVIRAESGKKDCIREIQVYYGRNDCYGR